VPDVPQRTDACAAPARLVRERVMSDRRFVARAAARIHSKGIADGIGTFETGSRNAQQIEAWFDGRHWVDKTICPSRDERAGMGGPDGIGVLSGFKACTARLGDHKRKL
jgi:hypothetical protein